jgi:hypothetical protein
MSKKTIYTTMRGNKIDVDLIKMKSDISTKEKTAGIIKREQFINDKRKRISKKRMEEMLANQLEVASRLSTKDAIEQINEQNNIVSEREPTPEAAPKIVPTSNNNETDSKRIRKKK